MKKNDYIKFIIARENGIFNASKETIKKLGYDKKKLSELKEIYNKH